MDHKFTENIAKKALKHAERFHTIEKEFQIFSIMFKRILKKIINSFFTKNFSKTLFSLKTFFIQKKTNYYFNYPCPFCGFF